MNNELVGGGFEELSMDEAMLVNGGGIFDSVLGIIAQAFSSVIGSVNSAFPGSSAITSIVGNAATGILGVIRSIAEPIYSIFGGVF